MDTSIDGGKIVGVAIIAHNGEVISLPKPNRHHNVIKLMVDELKHPRPIKGKQGFINESGVFLDRAEAKKVAIKHNQLLGHASTLGILFSEDVW